MALSNEEKLKNFEDEVMSEAKKIIEEIENKTKQEFEEELDEGEEKLLEKIYAYIQNEIDKIRKEKSAETAQIDIKLRQDYFRYIDSVSLRVFNSVTQKLQDFMKSAEYADYLFESCKNVMEKTGTDIDIFFMPEDEEIMTGKVRDRLAAIFDDISHIEFKSDETIKTGGIRFFNRARHILINDSFDEKTERAKELLNSIIAPQFTAINALNTVKYDKVK